MQFKVRHRLTFNCPDFRQSEVPRSNRKTKTMLRSYRSEPKDTNFFDSSSTTCKDQKQIKTLVESKIQQLHGRMKSFFTHQRKTHLEHVAPEMEEIANSIIQLQEELNRPKSMAEIEEEKHSLLKRKVALLKEIEQTNKKLKEKKLNFYQLKFETQQIDQQLKNGHATIAKYKRKLQADQNKLQHRNNSERITNQQPSQSDVNLDKILNQSVCKQNTQSLSPKKSVYQMTEQTTQRQMDHVHITEVMGDVNKKLSKQNKQIQKTTVQSHGQDTSIVNESPVIQDGIKQKQQLKKSQSVASGMIKKKAYFLNSDAHHKQNVKLYIKPTFSNNSFEDYMQSSSLLQDQIQKPNKNYKYAKSVIKHTQDMSSELMKYAQLANKQKWKKINSIFAELQRPPAKHCLLPKSDQSETGKNKKNQVHISDLEELLMDELRKEQFQSFKEKGYHEGLKDKTHQIKIEIKRIFKNYSPDEFFESIINKKPIQKQLAVILEGAFV